MEFDVKSISQICNVSEEQVRRWIRKNELVATKHYGVKGALRGSYTITEKSLVDFCYEHPKYWYVLEKHGFVRCPPRDGNRRFTSIEIECMIYKFRKFLEEL